MHGSLCRRVNLRRGLVLVNSGSVHNDVRARQHILRHAPGVLQTAEGYCTYYKPCGDEIDNGYLGRICATQDSRCQICGALTDLVKIRPVVKECAAVGFS